MQSMLLPWKDLILRHSKSQIYVLLRCRLHMRFVMLRTWHRFFLVCLFWFGSPSSTVIQKCLSLELVDTFFVGSPLCTTPYCACWMPFFFGVCSHGSSDCCIAVHHSLCLCAKRKWYWGPLQKTVWLRTDCEDVAGLCAVLWLYHCFWLSTDDACWQSSFCVCFVPFDALSPSSKCTVL